MEALQAATATSWEDDALHAFFVQQKPLGELEKMHLVWMDFERGGVCVLLSLGISSASPLCHAHLVELTFSWLSCPREQIFL